MFLMKTHPFNPPLCYVVPTDTMVINTGKHVDHNGRIYLPYLHEWKHPNSDLIGLIEVMRVVFGEVPPVLASPNTAAQHTMAPRRMMRRETAAQPLPTNVPPSSSSNFPPWRMTTMPAETASSRQTAAQPLPTNVPPSSSNNFPPWRMTASSRETAAQLYPSRHTTYPDMTTYPKENAVFLSYQWDHQDRVLLLHDRLQERGYGCWMDIKQMGGGDSLYQMMDKGIREAKVIVSCVTPPYVESPNCQDEVALARTLKKPIIPVILEKTTWPVSGPMAIPFAQLVYIDMARSQDDDLWKGPLFEELIRRIECFMLDSKDKSAG
ncbi:PREDICTED: uncharacterized protein LOC109478932 [Branchiostoma belcheri]|uniref:Uncharacterized protein LOC109478932 n=1 Tax=Branchiostoma belcheri TaxID=7741 RepID=A0A6P4ZZA0_BRABE|nr:PREDICTED: uncharacterized protein LOC109478932 [Branchiostoma belcheri]